MLKGIDIQALAAKIKANENSKQDFIVPANKMEMQVDTQGATAMAVPDHGSFPLLSLAHRQLGTFVNVPAAYYDRMLKDEPRLLADNVNTWLSRNQPNTKRMVRVLHNKDRAILSNSYQRIEHEEIAAAALPVLADLPGVQIVSAEITDQRLYIHFVVPTIQGEVKKGDVVQAGGIISNSEVGLGSVSVTGLTWRLICLNGAKTCDVFRKAHLGRRVEESEELWADDTRHADDNTVLLKVRDMVRAVVDETRFKASLAKLQGLTEMPITGTLVKAVEVLSNKVGLQHKQNDILEALAKGGDLSAWGMVNAITSQAHTAANYDEAVNMEAIGGNIIDLPATQWAEVLKAA